MELHEDGLRYEPVDAALRSRGIGESRPLSFCTPYGCSKGAADQYVLDWAASYRVPTVVFRMSCIYGPHQFGTEDQGWVAHFLIRSIEGEPITIYGDGYPVRDLLYVDDLLDALMLARENAAKLAGLAFNIGGGPENAVSLLELIDQIAALGLEEPEVIKCGWRVGDQRYYVSDTSRFERLTGWRPAVSPAQGLALLGAWLSSERIESPAAA